MQFNQDKADLHCRKQCREAKSRGHKVGYSLSRMIDAKVPISTIMAVLRSKPSK